MIKEFVLAYDENKDKLEEFIRTHKQEEYCEYEQLVKLLFDLVINPGIKSLLERLENRSGWSGDFYDTKNINVIDDGDYQGTQIFILHKDVYQPSVSDYVYTNTYYGSCSGCDILQGIHDYRCSELPTESQVEDYMTLCLHLLQSCVYMVDGESEVVE